MRGRGKNKKSNMLGAPRVLPAASNEHDLKAKLETAYKNYKVQAFVNQLHAARKAHQIGGLSAIQTAAPIDYETAIVNFTSELSTTQLTQIRVNPKEHKSYQLTSLLTDGYNFQGELLWSAQMFYQLKAKKPFAENILWWTHFMLTYKVNNFNSNSRALLDQLDDNHQVVIEDGYSITETDDQIADFILTSIAERPHVLESRSLNIYRQLASNLTPERLTTLTHPNQTEQVLGALASLPTATGTEYFKPKLNVFAKAIIHHPSFTPQLARNWVDAMNNTSKADAGQLLVLQELASRPDLYSIKGATYHAVEKTVSTALRFEKDAQRPDYYQYDQLLNTNEKRDTLVINTIKTLASLPTWEERFTTRFARSAHEIYPANPKKLIQMMIDLPSTSSERITRMKKLKSYKN